MILSVAIFDLEALCSITHQRQYTGLGHDNGFPNFPLSWLDRASAVVSRPALARLVFGLIQHTFTHLPAEAGSVVSVRASKECAHEHSSKEPQRNDACQADDYDQEDAPVRHRAFCTP
jgi:hypothetical protein